MDEKEASGRVLPKAANQPKGYVWIGAEPATIRKAERYELRAAASIVPGWQADVFSSEAEGRICVHGGREVPR